MNEIAFGEIIRLIVVAVAMMAGIGAVARIGVAVAHAAALVAQLRLKATDVRPLSDGRYVVVEGGLLGSYWTPMLPSGGVDRSDAQARRYEFYGEEVHRFAIRLLEDSNNDFITSEQGDPAKIRGIRYYPKESELWRKAIDYLRVNWDVESTPMSGTWAGPNYQTVYDLLKDARERSPSPTRSGAAPVRETAQFAQQHTVKTG